MSECPHFDECSCAGCCCRTVIDTEFPVEPQNKLADECFQEVKELS